VHVHTHTRTHARTHARAGTHTRTRFYEILQKFTIFYKTNKS
jgi:hypothetical protein